MASALCPYGEEDLLPVALGQTPSEEFQAHLEECQSCQQRLEKLRSESSMFRSTLIDVQKAAVYPPAALPPAAEVVPGTIGKYFVVGKLGQGGQAIAYRALHPELPKELVIKYAKEPVDAGAVDRDLLVREGRLLAGLDHPNLVRIIDLDFHEGRPFVVMEYHRGVNLQQFAGGQKPGPRQAAALVAPLARALGAAHRRGIVHQDVKPANILIDETGKPYLLDFGLARLGDAWNAETAQPGGGTPTYMAPEQVRGDADKVGPGSDIFALGGVLYFLLTGKAPFLAGDWLATRMRASQCDFDRTALRATGIPRRLAAICLRAMAAEPAERYASAEDLAADLEHYLRRPRRLLLLAVAASLLLAGVALWHFWPNSSRPVEPPLQQHLITSISRDDKGKREFNTLSTAEKLVRRVPLRVGDRLELGYEVPRGFQSALFLVTSAGEVRALSPLQLSSVGSFDHLRFPAQGVWQVEGPRGPVFFLACANRQTMPRLEDVRRLIQEDGDKAMPLPAPEEEFLFLVNRDKVVSLGEEPREVIATRFSQLRDRLERLRVKAAGQFEHVWGVALPVR